MEGTTSDVRCGIRWEPHLLQLLFHGRSVVDPHRSELLQRVLFLGTQRLLPEASVAGIRFDDGFGREEVRLALVEQESDDLDAGGVSGTVRVAGRPSYLEMDAFGELAPIRIGSIPEDVVSNVHQQSIERAVPEIPLFLVELGQVEGHGGDQVGDLGGPRT